MSSKRARLRSWLAPAIAAVLLCAAFWVLHGELQAIRYRDLQAALARLGAEHLLLALLCYGPFGEVAVYPPAGKATSIALFISGDGGWNPGVVGMARHLTDMHAIVVGIDIRRYLYGADSAQGQCRNLASDSEGLAHAVQRHLALDDYLTPILVGYSSGAEQCDALDRLPGRYRPGLRCRQALAIRRRHRQCRPRLTTERRPRLLGRAQLATAISDHPCQTDRTDQAAGRRGSGAGRLAADDGACHRRRHARDARPVRRPAQRRWRLGRTRPARGGDAGDARAMPVMPELARMGDASILCIHGVEEPDSPCPRLAGRRLTAVALPGGHHFDGNYQLLVRRIIEHLQAASGTAP